MKTLRNGLTILFDEHDFNEFVGDVGQYVSIQLPTEYPVAVIHSRGSNEIHCSYVYYEEMQKTIEIIDEYRQI